MCNNEVVNVYDIRLISWMNISCEDAVSHIWWTLTSYIFFTSKKKAINSKELDASFKQYCPPSCVEAPHYMLDIIHVSFNTIRVLWKQVKSTPILTITSFHLFQFYSCIWNGNFIALEIFSRNPKNDINATIKCQTKCHSLDFKMHFKLFMKFLHE